MLKARMNNHEHLTKPAHVFSLIGGFVAIVTFALSVAACIYVFCWEDTILTNLKNSIHNWHPDYQPIEVSNIAVGYWNTYAILSIVAVVWSVYCCVVNWVSVPYTLRAKRVGVYSTPMAILQLFALPFGTISGFLLIIALIINREKIVIPKSKLNIR
jgi:hypothetical protein